MLAFSGYFVYRTNLANPDKQAAKQMIESLLYLKNKTENVRIEIFVCEGISFVPPIRVANTVDHLVIELVFR